MNDAEDIPGVSVDLALVQKAVDVLGEHFDSVQIFVTRHESGTRDGTLCLQLGVGNFYARYGHVREWLLAKDELSRKQE